MNLHKQIGLKKAGRKLAPILSRLIQGLGLTTVVRKNIAYSNYLLGRGAGTGWVLESEVKVATDSIHRKEPVVFDVGGNVGKWSSMFRSVVPHGELYVFEPQPACQKAINERSIPDIELVKAAVGAEAGKMTLYSSSATDGSASLHKREDSYFEDRTYEMQMVDVIKLDDFIEERGIDFIDYIKFDIEGHELSALNGLKKRLLSKKIGAFSFEFGSGNLNSRTCFRDFWNLLSPLYDIFIITPSGRLEVVLEYYEDMEFYRGVSNYVAKVKS